MLALHWLSEHWPIVVKAIAALIGFSTVFVGTSDYPARKKLLFDLLDSLSLATYSNSPGSLKMLGRRSRRPGDSPPPAPKGEACGGSTGPSLTSFILIFLCVTNGSCTWFSKHSKQAAKDFVDCTSNSLQSHVAHIVPVVTEVLNSDSATKSMLEALALEVGNDAVSCAVEVVARDLQKPSFEGKRLEPSPTAARAILRAKQYNKDRKVKL